VKAFVEVVQVQEYKLHKIIGVPAMWATLFSGAFMLFLNSGIFQSGGWIYAKLFALLFLFAYHISLGKIRLIMIENAHYKSSKWFRVYNEAPTLLMMIIVIMVVVKPF